MRLNEGVVRYHIELLNRMSKCKYKLRKAYAYWQLYCEDFEYRVTEGYTGSLREVFGIVRGIREYLYYEKKKEEQIKELQNIVERKE